MKYLKLFEEFGGVNEAVSQENINAMFSEELQKDHKSLVTYLKKLFKYYVNRVPFGQFGVREDHDLKYLTLRIFGTDDEVTFYGIDITNTGKDFTKMDFDFDWQEGELAIKNAFEQSYREISDVVKKYIVNYSTEPFGQKYTSLLDSIGRAKNMRGESKVFFDVFTNPNKDTAPAFSKESSWGGPRQKASIFPVYFDFVLQAATKSWGQYYYYYESVHQGGPIIDFGVKNFDSGEDEDTYRTIKETPEYKDILDLGFAEDSTTPVIAKSENLRFTCTSDILNLYPLTAYSKGPVRVGSKPPGMVGSGANWQERLRYVKRYFLKQMITHIVSPRVEPRIPKKTIDELSNLPAAECYQELLDNYTAGFIYWMNKEDKKITEVIMDKIDFSEFVQKDPEVAIVALKNFMNFPTVKKAFQESDLDDETKGYADDLGGLSDLGF